MPDLVGAGKKTDGGQRMLSSKDILKRAGISRSTLNNYIALGILPKPVVRPDQGARGHSARVGYFPANVLDTLEQVSRLKRGGHSMATIAERLVASATAAPAGDDEHRRDRSPARPAETGALGPLMLSVSDFDHPAYLVNTKFEVEWANAAAEHEIFALAKGMPSDLTERNLFAFFAESGAGRDGEAWNGVLRFHLAIAKKRLSKAALFSIDDTGHGDEVTRLGELYDTVEALPPGPLLQRTVELRSATGELRPHHLYATFFREGVFFAYVPVDDDTESLLAFLARRDLVIRDLLESRRPYLTPLTVLVADIQGSVKICAELPPEEYFELINHVWGAMAPLLRKYYGTYGKHVGDGMVYYFFPQPDCNHIMNALSCALEMKEIMRTVSRKWQRRKNWANELQLNIGLDEGEEWFGSYRTPTHLEFTALGDTINRSARLSDFAREGTVWATKNMIGKLPSKLRATVRYGIRRRTDSGETVLIDSSYSRISSLVDLDIARNGKFQDIAVLPVAEIFDIDLESELSSPSPYPASPA